MRRRLIGLLVLTAAAPLAALAANRKGSKRKGGEGSKSGKGSHYEGGRKGAPKGKAR